MEFQDIILSEIKFPFPRIYTLTGQEYMNNWNFNAHSKCMTTAVDAIQRPKIRK